MSELLPCPFCGGEAALVPTLETTVREWFVTCSNLECSVLACRTKRYYTEAEAIAAWNTRAERTCRNISGKNWWAFECSECGEMIEQGVPEYCPECGAKVVDA